MKGIETDTMMKSEWKEGFEAAAIRGLNFFIYRMPDGKEIRFGCSERTLPAAVADGFLISPFDGRPEGTLLIPADMSDREEIDGWGSENSQRYHYERDFSESMLYPVPQASTTREKHRSQVTELKRRLAVSGGKTVSARVIRTGKAIDLSASFAALCEAYPRAFVFCFHTPQSGTWMGATPETLLIKRGNSLRTMALAGSRRSGSDVEWDAKNIEEQAVVTRFIRDTFIDEGFPDVKVGDRTTRQAGPVEHLCTTLEADIGDGDALRIARQLSPTPALSGYPREDALRAIRDTECFSRGYYGGFAGPVSVDGDMSLFVNLRCALATASDTFLFAGGGILAESDPDTEWEETEIKASTLQKIIEFQ